MEKGNKKVELAEIGKNCIYIFFEAFKICPLFFSIYILLSAISNSIDSILVIVLYKYLLDCTSNIVPFKTIVIVLILVGGVGGLITISIKSILSKIYDIKIMDVNKIVNQRLFKKASTMDISFYDDVDFYNNYVRAIQQGEVQVNAAIKAGSNIVSIFASITSLTGVVFFIDRKMVLFPLFASILHLLINMHVTHKKYEMQKELTPYLRKKEYCRRVFYQPEFSKEIRMTEISNVHNIIYNESTNNEITIVKKFAKKIRNSILLNSIFGWVILVYYLPMQYLIYNSLAVNKLLVSDVAAMNETNQSLVSALDNLNNNVTSLQEIGLFGRYYRSFFQTESNIETRKGLQVKYNNPQLIEFKNVSFAYDKENEKVLKNVSLKIEPGKKVAIVGYNGSGKSTFIKLLLNLYSPSEGNILYNDINVNDYECKAYRSNFSTLFQDFQTYAMSIKENITMGNDEQLIEQAMKYADIYEKLQLLPKGLESILSKEFNEDGVLLSGGESQRVALARLYLESNPIIILDEHTSAMDPLTEKKVNDIIFDVFHNKTIICISHHLSSICDFDYIYFFENGEIVEQGTHEFLMKLGRRYKLMYDKQSSYYEY